MTKYQKASLKQALIILIQGLAPGSGMNPLFFNTVTGCFSAYKSSASDEVAVFQKPTADLLKVTPDDLDLCVRDDFTWDNTAVPAIAHGIVINHSGYFWEQAQLVVATASAPSAVVPA
ncbi:MAG: hypothetical protein JNL32_16370 [Candidatus Kapabacteria bacterium]|nr:hypothetical protein [Candidatus Kapabacteria bacterium]